MDAVGFGSAVSFSVLVTADLRPLFSRQHDWSEPRALILADSYSFLAEGWDDVECDPAELWGALGYPSWGEDYMPSVAQIALVQEVGRAVRSGVGQRCDIEHQRAVSVRSITLARHV